MGSLEFMGFRIIIGLVVRGLRDNTILAKASITQVINGHWFLVRDWL